MELCGKRIRVEGGLIRTASLVEGYQFLEHPEAAPAVLRELRPPADLFTFIQKFSEPTPKYRFPMEWDNFAVLPVSTFDNWIEHQINFKVRNKVRKAEKQGIFVREVPFDDALVDGVHAILNESPIRQGKPFPHYGKNREAVRIMASNFLAHTIFVGAFFQNQMIGFIQLVTNEDGTQAGLMQIVSMIQHRDKAPTNALVAQAVRSCATRRIPYLWYANFSYGKKQQDSLADFKRHNGFQKVDVPRYYIPLTVRGRMALRLGLHHGMIDWVPEWVISAYRKIRSRWYAQRYPGLVNA